MIHLVDSNIVIYTTKPEYGSLGKFLAGKTLAVSLVTFVEVLGFHQITAQDKEEFEIFFAATELLPISSEIADKAVELRQQRRMSLGDSLIAATALVGNCLLVTNNTKDFKWIDSLNLLNPLDE